MTRREFITLLGGAAVWPLAARAQQRSGKISRIGILGSRGTAVSDTGYVAFIDELRRLRFTEGQNLVVDYHPSDMGRDAAFADQGGTLRVSAWPPARSRPIRAFSATPHDGQRPCRTLAEDPGRTQSRAAYPQRRSSSANSLQSQNSADSRESVRSFKGIICVDISEFESYVPSQAVGSL